MSEDVRRDAELLDALLNLAPVVSDRVTGGNAQFTVLTLRDWTDRSQQMISQYRNGITNVPVEFWRRILDHWLDDRILDLICPSDCSFDIHVTAGNGPASAPEFFREAVTAEGAHHEQMKYVAEMLADGRIDELDGRSVKVYHDAWLRHRARDAVLHRAILNTYHRTIERKAGVR